MNILTIRKDSDNLYVILNENEDIISSHATFSDANVELYRLLSYTTWIF
jgi:hypothetical protein